MLEPLPPIVDLNSFRALRGIAGLPPAIFAYAPRAGARHEPTETPIAEPTLRDVIAAHWRRSLRRLAG